MLAYHPYWLEASSIVREAKHLLKRDLITPEQFRIIGAAFRTPLSTSNVLERIGLFIFTSACVAGIFFFATETLADPAFTKHCIPLLAIGMLCFASLELLIGFKKVFRAGIDDALLYAGLVLTIAGLLRVLNTAFPSLPLAVHCLLALPFPVLAAIRYVDRICAAASFVCLIAILWILYQHEYDIGTSLLSFDIMLLSVVAFFTMRKIRGNKMFAPWHSCIAAIEISTLFTFSLAGNYFVVETFMDSSMSLTARATYTINAAPFYYAFTLLVPVSYVVLGLINRDRMLLRVGLIAEALSLLTLRYYVHAIAIEHALIILGISLILMTIVAIQLLKTTRNGFTHKKVPLQLPENVPGEAVVLFDRLTAQKEAVKAFETGNGHFRGGGTSLGW
jgi:hypothetical protein